MLSDYQKVCEFNKAFDFPQYDNFDDEKCLKLRLDLIREELDELQDAYEINDYIEEQDACADILYVAYGMAYTYKIHSDKVLDNYYSDKSKSLYQNLCEHFKTLQSLSISNVLSKLKNDFTTLKMSLENKDQTQWIELLHEFIVYVYRFQYVRNYDSDRVFTIVHESNMSKLCKSEEEAKLTVEKYASEFKDEKSPYDSPYYYPLDNGLYVVKNKSSGKALKSINYVKVKLI